MPNKNKNVRKTTKKIRGRRAIRRKSNSNIGKLIGTGIKSLISSIPMVGPVLSDIADFAFKSIAVTKDNLKIGDVVKPDDLKHCCLAASFLIKPSAILCGSRACVTDLNKRIISEYIDGRVISMTITVFPSGAFGQRNGDWHLGFHPLFNESDIDSKDFKDPSQPTEQGIHHMYMSTSGPAHKSLSLTYRPKIHDGRAFQFVNLDKPYGMIAIRFDNYDRSVYSEFTPDQFSCDTRVTGKIEVRSTGPQKSGVHYYTDFVTDKIESVEGWINRSDGTQYTLTRNKHIMGNPLVVTNVLNSRNLEQDFEHIEIS